MSRKMRTFANEINKHHLLTTKNQMNKSMDSTKALFVEGLIYTYENDDLMRVWNAFCVCDGLEIKVYDNTDENIEDMLSNLSRQEILTLGKYSNYNDWDDYVLYDGEEINSANEVRYLINEDNEDFKEYLINNEVTEQGLLSAFSDAYLDNSSLDEEVVEVADIEIYLKKLYDDIYEALREDDWEDIIDEIDQLIGGGDDEE